MVKNILLLLICFNLSYSQDSSKIITLDEVEVLSEKYLLSKDKLPFSISIISEKEIKKYFGSSISKIINGTSGTFLKSYGGIGSVETISIRGMGSEYVVVLIDGIRISNYQNGNYELGTFLTKNIEKIEIIKGGSSSIFGSNAIGGVVNLVSKKPEDELNFLIESGIGSYGLISNKINFSGNLFSTLIDFNYQNEEAENNYDFIYFDGLKENKLNRIGSAYNLKMGSFRLIPKLISNQFDFTVKYKIADRNMPSAVTSIYQNSDAKIKEAEIISIAKYHTNISNQLILSSTASITNNDFTYSNILFGKLENDRSKNDVISISTNLNYLKSYKQNFNLSIDISKIKIEGNKVGSHIRNQIGVNLNSIYQDIFIDDLIFTPSIGNEYYSDFKPASSYLVGVNYKLFKNLNSKIRINYSKNFRTPTFNDLYWIGSGNSNLKQEKSFQSEIGINTPLNIYGNSEIDFAFFNINSIDRIIWVPWKNGIWRPINLSRVISNGFELDFKSEINATNSTLQINYSFLNARRFDEGELKNKLLAYLPQNQFMVSIDQNLKYLDLSLKYYFSGERYTNENNDLKSLMNYFHKTDLFISSSYDYEKYNLQIQGSIENLFNENYQVIKSFPMPMRNYKLTISINYK